MKAVALVSQHNNSDSIQWQFDKIMSAIAYDLDLTVVFIHKGLKQVKENTMWKTLQMYGVEEVYYLSQDNESIIDPLFTIKKITNENLKRIFEQAEVFL
jgi:sulfur relay (sulfurtransferase) DsrF/TusC family protein